MKKIFVLYIFTLLLGSCSQQLEMNNEPGFLAKKNEETWKAESIKAKKNGNSLVIEVENGLEKMFLYTSSTATGVYNYGMGESSNFGVFTQSIDGTVVSFTTDVVEGPVKSIAGVIDNGDLYIAGIANTSSTGNGQGLRVKTNVTLGKIQSVELVSPGQGYKSGDIVTILGGNGNGRILIKDVIYSNGFVKITKNVGGVIDGEFLFTAKKIGNNPPADETVTLSNGIFYNLKIN